MENESLEDNVLPMRPAADFDRLTGDQFENVCEVLADFADVKSRVTWNHSLEVAQTSVAIGRQLGRDGEDLSQLKRAALVHDLGKAAVPVGILDKDLTWRRRSGSGSNFIPTTRSRCFRGCDRYRTSPRQPALTTSAWTAAATTKGSPMT